MDLSIIREQSRPGWCGERAGLRSPRWHRRKQLEGSEREKETGRQQGQTLFFVSKVYSG